MDKTFETFISTAPVSKLITFKEQLEDTNDPEFNELIFFMNKMIVSKIIVEKIPKEHRPDLEEVANEVVETIVKAINRRGIDKIA